MPTKKSSFKWSPRDYALQLSVVVIGILGSSVGLRLQGDALEVLKSSEISSSVGDKSLLMEVLGCYSRMTQFSQSLDEYNHRKMNAMDHLFESLPQHDLDYFSIGGTNIRSSWKVILEDRVCRSFLGFSAYFLGDDDALRRLVTEVDETIAQIQQKYALE